MTIRSYGFLFHMFLLLKTAGLALAALPALAMPPSAPLLDTTTRSDLAAYAEQQADLLDVPGLAWAVVDADGVEAQGSVGVDGNEEPVTASTPFIWGSVAKPIAADLTVRLAEDSVLDLDSAIAEFTPDLLPEAPDVTVRDLLDHTSGLPASFGPTDHDRGPSLDPVIDDLGSLDVGARGDYLYSSLNYLALTVVIEAATGRAYADVLRERVLAPAGMDGAAPDLATVPPGHRYVFGRTVTARAPADEAGLGYGYLAGSIDDLSAFARATLTGDAPGLGASDADAAYSLGWRHHTLDDVGVEGSTTPIAWHGGAVPGFQTGLIVLPEQDRAVVVVQNAYSHLQDEALLQVSVGLAALVAEQEPPAPRGVFTGTYVTLLVVLGGLVVALSATLVAAATRTRPPRRVWPQALLAAIALLLAAWGLPSAMGVGWTDLRMWAPDVGWTAYAVLALAVANLVLSSAHLARRARGQQGRGDHSTDRAEEVPLP